MGMTPPVDETLCYILPIKAVVPHTDREFIDYLRWLGARVEAIVVDHSAPDVFAEHAAAWGAHVRHVPLDPRFVTPMGKVGNVLTGLHLASHEKLIIADDDVRYDATSLEQLARSLDTADVVRPQNYFDPLPWHARWDSGRMLLNRVTGGDWPGTLGVRRAILLATNGYDGRAMFENLELERTVRAAGGRERVLYDVFVLRRPSTTRHFFSQRVRQAYDEMARPTRLIVQLALLPVAILGGGAVIAFMAGVSIVIAEAGRQRDGATRYFPASTALFAPFWLAERAICSWLALLSRIVLGGVPYRGTILRHAATSMKELRAKHAPVNVE